LEHFLLIISFLCAEKRKEKELSRGSDEATAPRACCTMSFFKRLLNRMERRTYVPHPVQR
jgi:hypothetical protein